MSDSTKCEEECPLSTIPYIESDKESEVSESTKCEIEIIPHLIREISDPEPNIPHNKSERISELCESTKRELEMFPHNIKEMSDPPNEKREEYSITNLSQNSLSLQYMQVQKAYLSALLQRWEIEIQEQIWRTWSTTTQGGCVKIDFQKGIQVLNEVKQKGSSILMHPEVCTYELLKCWRNEIREKLLGTSISTPSIHQYKFFNH